MPWTNSRSRSSREGSWIQTAFNVLVILAIVVFFFIVQSYRASIDMMEARIADLGAKIAVAEEDGEGSGDETVSVGFDAEALQRDVSTMRARIGLLDGELKRLSAGSVDIRSMEALRDEMLTTRERLDGIETDVETLDTLVQETEDPVAAEDGEDALAEARAAREELQRFKTLLGYGDM